MGGTSWFYWTDYQPDIQKALDEFRQAFFERLPQEEKDRAANFTPEQLARDMAEDMGIYLEGEEEIEEFKAEYPESFLNFEHLSLGTRLAISYGFDGTGTILDVDAVIGVDRNMPCMGVMRPLSQEQYLEFFETLKPTREKIDKADKNHEINGLCRKYEGIFVIAYEGDKPSAIYFTGASGDSLFSLSPA